MFLPFHPLTLDDKETVQKFVFHTECRNCDLNFMNLVSWRFLYETELAVVDNWLLFRFKADGHLAYLPPIGEGDFASIVKMLLHDAKLQGHAFLMLGICENKLAELHKAIPNFFQATANRNYADYIYKREDLASLTGKRFQSKRNFVNRFIKCYPTYEVLPLTRELIPQCITLDEEWETHKKTEADAGRYTYEAERKSLLNVFKHWEALNGQGIAIRVNDHIIAFTYGAPINYDTFDVCAEKADTNYEGAFAIINKEFACRIPQQYVFINREEDLGIEGLRRAKISYHPEIILNKYTVIVNNRFA